MDVVDGMETVKGCGCTRDCGSVTPKEAVDFAEFRPIVEAVFDRLKESIRKHGDWAEYTSEEVFEKVSGEFDEYREAFVRGQVPGDHGQIEELVDLAVVAVKGIRRLLK